MLWRDERIGRGGIGGVSRINHAGSVDRLAYCLCLSNALEIDVSQAVQDKLVIAGRKYPPAAYHGRAGKPGQIEV